MRSHILSVHKIAKPLMLVVMSMHCAHLTGTNRTICLDSILLSHSLQELSLFKCTLECDSDALQVCEFVTVFGIYWNYSII